MKLKSILVTIDGAVARLVLNRREKLNSLDQEMMLEIHQALDLVEASGEVRVLVITGSGLGLGAQ